MSYQTAVLSVLFVFCVFWLGFWLGCLLTTDKESPAEVETGGFSPDLQKEIDTMRERTDELIRRLEYRGGKDGISQ